MAHKTLVGGTAYEIGGGKTLVNGTAYSIKNGKTLVGGTAYEVGFGLPAFAYCTWEEIIAACQSKAVPDTWAVGDQKAMTINGTDYLIDIIGKNHDTYSDGSGMAPLTFQFHDSYATKYAMEASDTNINGWEGCAMRLTHLPTIKALMPTVVQNAIKNVNKLTSAGNQSTTLKTTSDGLFLLSEWEVFGKIYVSAEGEGTQYEYFSNGNSAIKCVSGTANIWWERSPNTSNTKSFCCVTPAGTQTLLRAKYSLGVAPGFCF